MSRLDVNMTQGRLFGKMVLYTLPLLFSGVLQQLYHAADVIVVGNFAVDAEKALAAVGGSTGALTNLLLGLFIGLSTGTCVVLSRYIGANQKQAAHEVVHTAILSALIIGVCLSFVGIVLAKPLLQLLSTPAGVIDLATLYMRIYFLGLPMTMLYNFGSAVLRAKGNTVFPLVTLIVSGSVNVVLNYVLVTAFHLDVAGVAIATVTSNTLSALFVTIYLIFIEKDCCRLSIKRLRIYPDKLKKISIIGIPAGLQSIVFSFSNVMIQSSVNSMGETVMAGNAAAGNIDGFIYIAQNSVYHTAMTFTSQNLGTKNMKRVRRVAVYSAIIVTVIGLIVGGVVSMFAGSLLNIYAPGADKALVRESGLLRLQIMAITYFLCGLMEVLTGLLRGIGNSIMPMILSMIGICGIRVFWVLFIFPIEYFHNMFWLYVSFPVSWLITLLAQLTAYLVVQHRVSKQLEVEQALV